jgi:hypothetical protein
MDHDIESDRGQSRDYDYDYTQDQRYYNDRELRKQRQSGGCCSWTKAAVFLFFVGIALGILFGVVDIDKIKGWFGNVMKGDSDSGTEGSEQSFSFNQCTDANVTCCNGLHSNCDMSLNEVLFASVHNANHDSDFAPNNDTPLEQALQAGYRGLLLDVCKCDGVITFCHGICTVGNRDPEEVFNNIGTFLSQNPHDVVILNFEMSIGDPTPEELWNVMETTSIRSKTYIYSGGPWPTFNDMIEMDIKKQVVAFYHDGPDCPLNNSPATTGCHPRLINYHDYVVETPWDFEDVALLQSSETSCAENRGSSGTKDFYAINNFVTRSLGASKTYAKIVNSKSFVDQHIRDCESLTNYKANIVAVDFWSEGDLLEVTQDVNKARAAIRRSRNQ